MADSFDILPAVIFFDMPSLEASQFWDKCERTMPWQKAKIIVVIRFSERLTVMVSTENNTDKILQQAVFFFF